MQWWRRLVSLARRRLRWLVTKLADPAASRRIRVITLLVSISYLGGILAAGVGELGYLPWSRYLWASVVGLALYPVSLISQAAAWALALGLMRLGRPAFDWGDVQIYAASHLVRRLPGGIWYVGERIAAYRSNGIDPVTPIAASVAEWALLLVAATTLYLASRFASLTNEALGLAAAVIIAGASGWLAGQLLVNGNRVRFAGRGTGSRPVSPTAVGFIYLVITELYLGAFIVGGAILLPFINNDRHMQYTVSQAVGIWALTGGIGTVLGLLPAGFGVREATLALILSSHLEPPAPVVIAFLVRLLLVLGDLVWGSSLLFLSSRLRVSPAR